MKFQQNLGKSLKEDAVKDFIHYVSKSARPWTGKDQSSSQFAKKGIVKNAKNVPTIRQLHSFGVSKVMLKILHTRFNI